MPNARRVIFSTYVVPTFSIKMEEESVTKTEFQTSPAGTLGGKGSASIDATQWGDGWVSFSHQGAYWEDQGDVWELQGETWSGELSITAATDLTDDSSTTLAFLYIKNTGSVDVLISLNGTSGNYYILLSGGEAFASEIHVDSNVFVKTASGTSTIEHFSET